MKNFRFPPSLASTLGLLALCAAFTAQAQPAGHAGMNPAAGGHAMADQSESTRAFRQGEERMMKDMMLPYSGNADADFVARMIAHHQGAVDMAEVQLKYGKDPELRKMAQEIIKAQQEEIAFLKQWQARHGLK